MFTLNRGVIRSLVFLFFISPHVSFGQGAITGMALPNQYCDKGTYVTKMYNICYWDNNHTTNGIALFYGPSTIGKAENNMYDGFDKSYVPYAGLYKLRTRACPAESSGNCTVAKSTQYFDSLNAVQLNSSQLIIDQMPKFGGGSGTLSTSSTLCFTFISPDGAEWSTSALRTCQDAQRLPEVPSFCYLNGINNNFDVDMGTLERGTISTVPGSTTKKNMPLKVMCSGDASLSATFTLEYSPITIVGSEVVGSTINGVGVAIYINDKIISSKNPITMDFPSGISNINLGFEVVRDPYVNIGTIGTGDFSADAVLVMTKQ